jgi:hypothetical protein
MKRSKIAIVLAMFTIMVAEVIQGCDRETFVSLSVVTLVVTLIPVRYFRWVTPLSAIVVLVTFGPIGCVTRNNVVTKSVTPGPWRTNVVTHEDKSWSINQLGSSVSHNGNLLRFRAAVGGGAPPVGGRYGYNVGPGGYGYHSGGVYPIVPVPIESQRYYQEETWRRYGFDGGGRDHGGNSATDSDIQKFHNLSGPGSGPRGYGY